ncbi:MarR family winged helix-turn-helix transcriptional regulator [Sphingobium sp.]|uniref:MarR family winged helix-turn-helix transcriptional regulator n=1 Tax=Sphingobium sp. TaxID=1912891 RepID=UPI003B3B9DBA
MTESTDMLADADCRTMAGEVRALVSRLRRRMREEAQLGDLTPSQAAAWMRLERDGPLTISALARVEGMRPQSMGAIVTALETAGFVTRTSDPRDGRQSRISVTDKSRELVMAGRLARQDWLMGVMQRKLSRDEQADLAKAIPLLRRLAES